MASDPGLAWLGLGANLGDRSGAIGAAIDAISRLPETRLLARSGLYATAPWGVVDQDEFLNAAVAVETALAPRALLEGCLAIERALGRVRDLRWGPRAIDIDILAMDGVALAEPGLVLPHPHLTERAFALAPLAELAPGLVLEGRRVEEWLAGVDLAGIRRLEKSSSRSY